MKLTPVKGTNDYLPEEVALRDRLQDIILRDYRAAGFKRITTPILEDIENLDHSDGGENLALIFKIVKRGEKLTSVLDEASGKVPLSEALKENDLCDLGLRYDLTLPLSRYYANNRAKLPLPMKVIQLDRVYRAERPQKGRMREFIQCDIDIIGTESYTAEVELILTTARALSDIGLDDFTVRINDRSLLKAMIASCGIPDEKSDSVCIELDKLDKIGWEGVNSELYEKGIYGEASARLEALMSKSPFTIDDAEGAVPGSPAAANLRRIMSAVTELNPELKVVYDPTLVRGQGYYTGTVFEVSSGSFGSSVAGGGRYDGLIGKFTGENIPAVGFSIGFERIFSILSAKKDMFESGRKSVAVFYDEDENGQTPFIAAERIAETLRGEYDVSLMVSPSAKKFGKTLNNLKQSGYYGFYKDGEVKPL